MDKSSTVIPVLLFILSSSTSMNAIGLYLLHKDERRQTNQSLILKFLSGSDLFLSIILICRWVLIFTGSTEESRAFQIAILVSYAAYINVTFVIVFMTLDRFIATKFPFRSPYILSRRKATMILLSSIVTCIAIACISLLVNYTRFKFYVNMYGFPVISAIATIVILATYAYIFVTILRQRHLRSLQENIPGWRTAESQRFLKMAFIITASYLFCFLVPDILFAFFYNFFANFNSKIFYIAWYCGLLLDPITYIFMQEPLTDMFLEIFYLRSCRRNTKSANDNFVPGISIDRPWVVETKL